MSTSGGNLELWLREACVLEATARKPGNVHPAASFSDVGYSDFVRSAYVVAPVLAATRQLGVGAAILTATSRTSAETPGNTNLGMVLLLAPLAAVDPGLSLRDGVKEILENTTVEDARLVYQAIRLASPGGLGTVAEQDVRETPDVTLIEAMRLAADRDRVAAQYSNGFRDVLDFAAPRLLELSRDCAHWEQAVIGLHLSLLSEFSDTLIARKCGPRVAAEALHRARAVLAAGWPMADGIAACNDFDRWLRSDGHRRNPGTTADLVAAALFVALRDHQWRPEVSG